MMAVQTAVTVTFKDGPSGSGRSPELFCTKTVSAFQQTAYCPYTELGFRASRRRDILSSKSVQNNFRWLMRVEGLGTVHRHQKELTVVDSIRPLDKDLYSY